MKCTCGARSYPDHILRVRQGRATGHVYTGLYWAPLDAPRNDKPKKPAR